MTDHVSPMRDYTKVMQAEIEKATIDGKRFLILRSTDGWPDEPVYPDDLPAEAHAGFIIKDPRTNKSATVPRRGRYTFFEFMMLIHGGTR